MSTIQNIDLEIEKLKTAKDIAFEVYSHYSDAYFKLIGVKEMSKSSCNFSTTEILLNELINIANIDSNLLFSNKRTEEITNLKSSVINLLIALGCNLTNISKSMGIHNSTVHYHSAHHLDRMKYYKEYNNKFLILASYENHLRKILDTV